MNDNEADPTAPGTPIGSIFGPGSGHVATGETIHIRHQPTTHRFSAPVRQIWIDPDRPEELCDRHRLWSHRRPAPVRFRRQDYFDGTDEPIGPKVRDALADALGSRPEGALRMLTQPRTWGWLLNPLTLYFAWPDQNHGESGPVGLLLEVDNTPWHERHHYAVPLRTAGNRLVGTFPKVLHVSPFLDEDFDYRISVGGRSRNIDGSFGISALDLTINVVPSNESSNKPILHTRLRAELHDPTRATLSGPIRTFPTHRVSLGIHRQAINLFRKRVPVVRHPDKRGS